MDVYSLAVVLYECITGKTPFGGSVHALLYSIAHQPPPPFSSYGVTIEPAVNWLALLHLVRDPAGNHHDSAVEWAPDLVQSTSGLLLKFLLAELAVFVHQ